MSSPVRTYGGWRRTEAAGLGKFTVGQTIVLMTAGLGVIIVNWVAGWGWSLGIGVLVGAGAALVSTKDKYGMSIADRRKERARFRRDERGQKNLLRQSLLSPSKQGDGRCRLPGVLGRAQLTEHADAWDRRFGLIRHADGHVTVVLALSPAGEQLMDQSGVDANVAHFGLWLTSLSDEVGVIGASVTVETCPDTGERLRREVSSRRSQQAPELARRIIDGVVAAAGEAGARTETWASISFDPARMSARSRGRDQRAVTEIATRLPQLTQTLTAHQAGAVHVMRADEIKRLLRVAYDPASEAVFEQASASGAEIDLPFCEVGPVSHEAGWDAYRHDSGLSCSWVMRSAPRGTVQSSILRRLLEVSPDVERKRVSVVYRPMDPAKAPDVVERDVDRAVNKRRMAGRSTARNDRDLAQARQTSEEEAGGASILDFGVVVTATVSGSEAVEALVDARASVESLMAASKLMMRPAYGSQASAFALGLPIGVQPAQQMLKSALEGL